MVSNTLHITFFTKLIKGDSYMKCPNLELRKRCTVKGYRLVYCTGCKPKGLLDSAIREVRGLRRA